MAIDIDVSDPEKLTFAERLYLQDRGRLPEGLPPISQEERLKGGDEIVLVATAQGSSTVKKSQVAEYTGHGADDDEDDLPEYKDMSLAELQAEASERKLPTKGSKAELVERLEADDAKADGA